MLFIIIVIIFNSNNNKPLNILSFGQQNKSITTNIAGVASDVKLFVFFKVKIKILNMKCSSLKAV